MDEDDEEEDDYEDIESMKRSLNASIMSIME
jgi:hypothetical protein